MRLQQSGSEGLQMLGSSCNPSRPSLARPSLEPEGERGREKKKNPVETPESERVPSPSPEPAPPFSPRPRHEPLQLSVAVGVGVRSVGYCPNLERVRGKKKKSQLFRFASVSPEAKAPTTHTNVRVDTGRLRDPQVSTGYFPPSLA